MQEFRGFQPEMMDFLWELKMNNSKEWMEQNRERYRTDFKEPFDDFAFTLRKKLTEAIGEELDYSISRINRDVRYTKDKSPYRDSRWVVFKEPLTVGTEWKFRPVYYFEVSTGGVYSGVGFWRATPLYMKKFRDTVDQNPKALLKIVKDLEKKTQFVLDGEDYKKVSSAHLPKELQPWYTKKSLSLIKASEVSDNLFATDLPAQVAADWASLKPIYQYLKAIKED